MTVEIPNELVRELSQGNVVLFVGSGLSQGTGLPSWSQLMEQLATDIGCPAETDMFKIAQYYELKRGRNALIRQIIQATDTTGRQPTENHRLLAKLPIQTWVTTNYDDLLELTLREAGKRYQKIVQDQDLPYASAKLITLLKMHGSNDQPGSIVVTQEDYRLYFKKYPLVKMKLAALLLDKMFLFVGYSLDDPDFNQIQAEISFELQKHQRWAYAILFDADEFTVEDLKTRNIHVINIPVQERENRSRRLGEVLQELVQRCEAAKLTLQPVFPIAEHLEKPCILFEDECYRALFDSIYEYVKNDQIPESGGWGKSQAEPMRYITGRELSPFELQEGGITSTFIALRALRRYEGDARRFCKQGYAKLAKKYLLDRQARVGGFGRFVQSRSGVEIHPNLRHTALAISSLIDLDAQPKCILRGMKYLYSWKFEQVYDNAEPSSAIAGIIYTTEKFLQWQAFHEILTRREEEELGLSDWAERKKILFRELANMALDAANPFTPFWKPYAGYARMIYVSSLSTIDLISDTFPEALEPAVIQVLSEIMTHEMSGGLPFEPSMDIPDLGITAYFLSLVARETFLRKFQDRRFVDTLVQFCHRSTEFLLQHYPKQGIYQRLTYCDTLPNLLLLSPTVT
jgi:hypothetical protein